MRREFRRGGGGKGGATRVGNEARVWSRRRTEKERGYKAGA